MAPTETWEEGILPPRSAPSATPRGTNAPRPPAAPASSIIAALIGLGLYGGVGFGEYDTLTQPNTASVSLDRGTHSIADVGARLILFP